MKKGELCDKYFYWINQLVCTNEFSKNLSYKELMSHLHDIEFLYVVEKDKNRAKDGIDLRYRFGYEKGYSDKTINLYIDHGQASVLEVMAALALRMEETIMANPKFGDRTGVWFWSMAWNLGLEAMSDDNYDEKYVEKTIDIFLRREYSRSGKGALFTIDDCESDLREIEIWYQMCMWLNTYYTS